MAGEEAPRRPFGRRTKAVAAATGVVFVALGVAAALPTRLGAVSRAHPPIEDRTGRRAPPGTAGRCPLAGCSPPRVTSVREEEVSFPSSIPEKGVSRLNGTLAVPNGAGGKRPAVVILPAGGNVDRDGELSGDLLSRHEPFALYRALSDLLAREGFLVLRSDKRPLATLDYAASAQDGRDAIAYLAGRDDVDPHAIVVVGHGEGGFLAPDVARDDAHVAAVVLLAPIIGVFEGGATQIEEYGRIRLAQLDVGRALLAKLEASSRRRCMALARAHTEPHGTCLPPLDNERVAAAIGYTEHTPERLAALRVPVFALQGSVDRNVSPDTIPRLRDLLRGPEHDVEVHYVADVSHLFVDVVTRDGPPAIAPVVKERLHGFLASVFVTRR